MLFTFNLLFAGIAEDCNSMISEIQKYEKLEMESTDSKANIYNQIKLKFQSAYAEYCISNDKPLKQNFYRQQYSGVGQITK